MSITSIGALKGVSAFDENGQPAPTLCRGPAGFEDPHAEPQITASLQAAPHSTPAENSKSCCVRRDGAPIAGR